MSRLYQPDLTPRINAAGDCSRKKPNDCDALAFGIYEELHHRRLKELLDRHPELRSVFANSIPRRSRSAPPRDIALHRRVLGPAEGGTWSGLRLLIPAFEKLRDRRIPLRLITTSYMGASDPHVIFPGRLFTSEMKGGG